MSDEIVDALAQDVEYRTREIIQEAGKFMFHARRTKLTVEDVNYALQRLYGYDPAEALNFRLIPNTNIFYVPKEEFDLVDFIQQPLPKAPQPLTLTSHWLAIDGIQPMIPENPNLQEPGTFPDKENGPPTGPTAKKDLQEDLEVKPLVKHVLSKELQAYYDAIIGEILSADTDRIKAALYSIATDSGLQQLLPYFIQFVAEMIPKNLRSLPQLQILIGLISSLLANEHIFIEPYVRASFRVGKRLCEDPGKEDHWSLRDRCAVIASEICRKFGNTYSNLIPRVAKTMVKTFLDASKPLPSHYGAIVGLSALGAHTVDTLILPHVETYLTALGSTSNMMTDQEQPTQLEIDKCRGAVKNAASKWLAECTEASEPKRDTVRNLLNSL